MREGSAIFQCKKLLLLLFFVFRDCNGCTITNSSIKTQYLFGIVEKVSS